MNKKIIFFLSLILILSAVVVAGFFVWTFQTEKPEINKQLEANNNEISLGNNIEAKKEPIESKQSETKKIEINQQACAGSKTPSCYVDLALMSKNKNICELIDNSDSTKGDNKSFCVALVNRDNDICAQSDGRSGIKFLSTMCSAVAKKDYNLCDNDVRNIMGDEMADVCNGWVTHYNNLLENNFLTPTEYCQNFEYKERNFRASLVFESKEQCYRHYVFMIMMYAQPLSYGPEICKILDNNDDKDYCYSQVAANKKDVNICNLISNEYFKNTICPALIKK